MKLVAFLALALAILLAPPLPSSSAAARADSVVKAQGATVFENRLEALDSSPAKAGVIVVQNSYYAKPGMHDDVLRVRLEASAVLRGLGVRDGRILQRMKNRFDVVGADDPDVIWECDFPDEASLMEDARKARASPEFAAVQERMAAVARKFETRRWAVHE